MVLPLGYRTVFVQIAIAAPSLVEPLRGRMVFRTDLTHRLNLAPSFIYLSTIQNGQRQGSRLDKGDLQRVGVHVLLVYLHHHSDHLGSASDLECLDRYSPTEDGHARSHDSANSGAGGSEHSLHLHRLLACTAEVEFILEN